MPRLIRVFAGRTLTLLVSSWGGSIINASVSFGAFGVSLVSSLRNNKFEKYPERHTIAKWRHFVLQLISEKNFLDQQCIMYLHKAGTVADNDYLINCNSVFKSIDFRAAPRQNQQNDCAPSEDSDQPGHPPSLIRVFAVRIKQAWVISYLLSA